MPQSSPGIQFHPWKTQPPWMQHGAPETTPALGQMAEALCACKGTIQRELLQWDTASPHLKIEAKENLPAVQHKMCTA